MYLYPSTDSVRSAYSCSRMIYELRLSVTSVCVCVCSLQSVCVCECARTSRVNVRRRSVSRCCRRAVLRPCGWGGRGALLRRLAAGRVGATWLKIVGKATSGVANVV